MGLRVVAMFLLLLLGAGGCREKQPDASRPQETQASATRQAVENIRLVSSLPPKQGVLPDDVYAARVLSLGRAAGPLLAEKLTDTAETQVVQGFRYNVGDIALALLVEIYRPPAWPFPEGSEELPREYGDFRDYVEFFKAPDTRARLRDAWRDYVRKH